MTKLAAPVYVARLAGTNVFDPLGDRVGIVRDVVALVSGGRTHRAIGLVVEVPGRRRVFLPLTRVTSIVSGQVISTGLLNMRRFAKRPSETLVIGELLDREVTLNDGSGKASIGDVSIAQQRNGDWLLDDLYVVRSGGSSSLLRRRDGFTVRATDVSGLMHHTEGQSATALLSQLAELKPADVAERLHDLSAPRRLEVASGLSDDRLADVLEELGDDDRVELLSGLSAERAADVLDVMEPDDAADLLAELPATQADDLLARMEPEEAKDVRLLMTYDEDTAGGLMTTEPVILGAEETVATALAQVRREDLAPALASMVFVVRPPMESPTGRFIGVVHTQRLLREPPHSSIGAVIDTEVDPIQPEWTLEQVAKELATYNLLALPVVDDDRRLVGAVSVDDVLDHLLPEDWRDDDSLINQGGAK